MVFGPAVGEVDAHHVEAFQDQLFQRFRRR
jgi:hypothetical protein